MRYLFGTHNACTDHARERNWNPREYRIITSAHQLRGVIINATDEQWWCATFWHGTSESDYQRREEIERTLKVVTRAKEPMRYHDLCARPADDDD